MISGRSPKIGFNAGGAADQLGFSAEETLALQQAAYDVIVPAAPAIGAVGAGDGSLVVSFTGPANIGGLTITGYTATCGTQSVTGSASPLTVTGLTNGVAVTCSVAASNSVGAGESSTASASVTPESAPSVNGSPVASGVQIGGTVQVGSTLNGSYDYADAEDDAQGASTFRWLSSSDQLGANATAISGALTQAYAPVNADVGRYLAFCVTPIASTGATVGIEVCSPISSIVQGAVVDGVCGTANGVATTVVPAVDLCRAGRLGGSVTGDANAWTWICSGSAGGSAASCSAPRQQTGTNPGTDPGIAGIVVSGGTWVLNSSLSAGFIPSTGHPKSPPNLPGGVSFPQGLVDFTLDSGTPGSTASVVLTFPAALPPGAVYWKYGKTSPTDTPHWYVLKEAVINGATVTLSLTDGGSGDEDGTVNGAITDPGGPGVSATAVAETVNPVPTLSAWSFAGLVLLILLCGLTLSRKRQYMP